MPRIGFRLGVPAQLNQLEWFGLGPGEGYVDTQRALRVGRWSSSVQDLQTPYVRPQENGNRRSVRHARLTGGDGSDIELRGAPTFDLTARPWTSEQLDAARHPTDLVPSDRTWLNIDALHQGIGSASCGPGVLPPYQLYARPVTLTFAVRAIGANM